MTQQSMGYSLKAYSLIKSKAIDKDSFSSVQFMDLYFCMHVTKKKN